MIVSISVIKSEILTQEVLGVLAALTETNIAIGEEGATLLNDLEFGCQVEHITRSGNAFVEHDVELCRAERRRDFVLYHFARGCGYQ